eukprot:gene11968-2550_t
MDGTKREDELQHTITYQEHVLENSDGKNIEDRHETKLTRTANENEKLQDVSRENRTESDDFSGSRADSQEDSSDTIFSVPKRYVLAIMMFCGFMNMYAIRVNLNVAIGAMVKPHPVVKNGKHFIQGVMLPCNHQIWSYWAPRSERTILVTIALAGMNVGTIVTMPLTGLLTKYGFDGGWASVFYCFGAAGIVWWVLWAFLIHDTPAQHPSISKAERNYIERNVDVHKSSPDSVQVNCNRGLARASVDMENLSSAQVRLAQAVKIQWKAMLTSGPVWGVILGNIANDWGLYTILICLPLFLMDIMHFDVQAMGFIASLPFLLKAIVGPVGGVLADILRNGYMSTANVRRVFYVIGAMCAATMIVISGYTTSAMMAVASMCVGVALSGLMHSGYEVNVLDIAPGVSGIVMGISNTAGTITGFLSPLLVGVMTEDKKREQWQMVFWITFFLYLAGSIMFCILVSGEPQSWAVQNDDSESSLDDESS